MKVPSAKTTRMQPPSSKANTPESIGQLNSRDQVLLFIDTILVVIDFACHSFFGYSNIVWQIYCRFEIKCTVIQRFANTDPVKERMDCTRQCHFVFPCLFCPTFPLIIRKMSLFLVVLIKPFLVTILFAYLGLPFKRKFNFNAKNQKV